LGCDGFAHIALPNNATFVLELQDHLYAMISTTKSEVHRQPARDVFQFPLDNNAFVGSHGTAQGTSLQPMILGLQV
jgi:hypothetical protein